MRFFALLVPLCFAALLTPPLAAQTPADLGDAVGARGSSGQIMLERRGYRHIRVETVGDQKWSYWINDRSGTCVQVVTANGLYSAIDELPLRVCQPADSAET